jgi:hypothetical protein
MTTILRDPELQPVFTGYTGVDLREAIRRLIQIEMGDAVKLERMNHWAVAEGIRRHIDRLETLLRGRLPEQLAQVLKEMTMGPETGN